MNEITRHGGSNPPEPLIVYLWETRVRAFVVGEDEYYFNSSDVAAALGNADVKQLRKRIPEEHKFHLGVIATFGRRLEPPKRRFTEIFGAKSNAVYLTETGMWLSALEGMTPRSRAMKVWIAEKVMPEIARTGSFIGKLKDKEKKNLPDLTIKKAQKYENDPGHPDNDNDQHIRQIEKMDDEANKKKK